MSDNERWLSREEADALLPGSVIALGGYLALQKDSDKNGNNTRWLAAGDEEPAQLDDLTDEGFPVLLLFEADEKWLERVKAVMEAHR